MKAAEILQSILKQPGWRKVGVTALSLILSACGVPIPDGVWQVVLAFLAAQGGVDAVKAFKTQP